jgi:hypothetical protein
MIGAVRSSFRSTFQEPSDANVRGPEDPSLSLDPHSRENLGKIWQSSRKIFSRHSASSIARDRERVPAEIAAIEQPRDTENREKTGNSCNIDSIDFRKSTYGDVEAKVIVIKFVISFVRTMFQKRHEFRPKRPWGDLLRLP